MNKIEEIAEAYQKQVGKVPMGTFIKYQGNIFMRLDHSSTRKDVIQALNMKTNTIEYMDDLYTVEVFDAEIRLVHEGQSFNSDMYNVLVCPFEEGESGIV